MNKLILISLISALLAACASRPPEVTASRPLVEPSRALGGEQIDDTAFSDFLASAVVGASFVSNGKEVRLLKRYYSALGTDCVQYVEVGGELSRYVACKDDVNWRAYLWMSSGYTRVQSEGVSQ